MKMQTKNSKLQLAPSWSLILQFRKKRLWHLKLKTRYGWRKQKFISSAALKTANLSRKNKQFSGSIISVVTLKLFRRIILLEQNFQLFKCFVKFCSTFYFSIFDARNKSAISKDLDQEKEMDFPVVSYGTKYLRMDQVKFVEDSL